MKIAYAALLRLYPAPFRDVFADEMAEVFDSVQADRRARGFFEYLLFLLSEIMGVIGGALWMWNAGFIERSRRKLMVSYWVSIAAGVAIAAFFQGFFYTQMTHVRSLAVEDRPIPAVMPAELVPLLIAGGVFIFLAVFSIAFVWNMRMIGNRVRGLKPLWMPAGEMRGMWRLENRRKRSTRAKAPVKVRVLPIYNLDHPE